MPKCPFSKIRLPICKYSLCNVEKQFSNNQAFSLYRVAVEESSRGSQPTEYKCKCLITTDLSVEQRKNSLIVLPINRSVGDALIPIYCCPVNIYNTLSFICFSCDKPISSHTATGFRCKVWRSHSLYGNRRLQPCGYKQRSSLCVVEPHSFIVGVRN